MYKVINVQKKENKDSLFFFESYIYPKNFFEYLEKNYKKTGKLILFERTVLEDRMSNTSISIWKSRKDFLDYLTDPYIYDFLSKSNNYDIDNNINSSVTIEKEKNE